MVSNNISSSREAALNREIEAFLSKDSINGAQSEANPVLTRSQNIRCDVRNANADRNDVDVFKRSGALNDVERIEPCFSSSFSFTGRATHAPFATNTSVNLNQSNVRAIKGNSHRSTYDSFMPNRKIDHLQRENDESLVFQPNKESDRLDVTKLKDSQLIAHNHFKSQSGNFNKMAAEDLKRDYVRESSFKPNNLRFLPDSKFIAVNESARLPQDTPLNSITTSELNRFMSSQTRDEFSKTNSHNNSQRRPKKSALKKAKSNILKKVTIAEHNNRHHEVSKWLRDANKSDHSPAFPNQSDRFECGDIVANLDKTPDPTTERVSYCGSQAGEFSRRPATGTLERMESARSVVRRIKVGFND